MNETAKADMKIILALTLVHFAGDLYSSFVNPLLPVFAQRFSLSLTEVGLISGISRFLAFVVQPSAGYFADHYRTRLFVLGGPLLSVVFIPLVGIAPSFLILLLLISLGSIGSSMFHPGCAGMVSTYAGPRFGFAMGIFLLGGTLAFGVGPIFITQVVERYGFEASPWSMVPGLLLMLFLFRWVPTPQPEGLKEHGFIGSIREVFGPVWKPIVLIWMVMVLRSFVSQSFLTYLPLHFSRAGYSLGAVGFIVALITTAGAVSGLLAGYCADRFGYRPVFLVAHGLAAPFLLLLTRAHGPWVFLMCFAAGFFVMATIPLGVALAQNLAPKGRSMASSFMMGLALGTGGILTPLTGRVAEAFSIQTVLSYLSMVPLLSLALIVLVFEKRPAR